MMRYEVKKIAGAPALDGDFNGAEWSVANLGTLDNVRAESSDHHPDVQFRALHNSSHLFVRFQVNDRYVRSVQTLRQGPVCTDSCTEFFVRPRRDKGYFNFEVNAGGTMLLHHMIDHERSPQGFKKWEAVSDELMDQIEIWHSLPSVVEPEITEPTTWGNGWAIPLSLFENYLGPLGNISGQVWHANFYKCGDKTSHPHWLSWSPVSKLNFHLPECFGELAFA